MGLDSRPSGSTVLLRRAALVESPGMWTMDVPIRLSAFGWPRFGPATRVEEPDVSEMSPLDGDLGAVITSTCFV